MNRIKVIITHKNKQETILWVHSLKEIELDDTMIKVELADSVDEREKEIKKLREALDKAHVLLDKYETLIQ